MTLTEKCPTKFPSRSLSNGRRKRVATRWSLAQCGAVSCQRGELAHPRLRMSSRPAVRRVLDETDILIHDDLHVHSLRPASYVGRQRNSRFLHFERAKRPSCFFLKKEGPATATEKKKERVESADNKRSDRRASCIIGSSSALSACTHVLLDKLVNLRSVMPMRRTCAAQAAAK